VIFNEPHAYISPKHYDTLVSVPTWNYISVHAYGQGKLITDTEETFAILEKTIMAYEEEYKKQWDNLPIDYKLKLQKGIVGFEIEVNDLQAKKKLSQNKTQAEQQRIIKDLSNSENDHERQIADYMKANLGESKVN
jgi:transcriptional regulator